MNKLTPQKEKIYKAGAKLFHEKGYAATSMRQLASAVQLEVSSLYSHIKSKEEILQQTCFHTAQSFLDGIEAIYSNTNSPKQKIKALIQLHLEIAIEDETAFTVFNEEWRHMSEPNLSTFLAMRKKYQKRFLSILKEGIKTQTLVDMNPTFMMNTMLSAMKWVYVWYKPNKGINTKMLTRDMYKLLYTGIRNK